MPAIIRSRQKAYVIGTRQVYAGHRPPLLRVLIETGLALTVVSKPRVGVIGTRPVVPSDLPTIETDEI